MACDSGPGTGQARGAAAETTVRVRYAETDQMGRAYYGAYFTWLEVARVELLRQAGFTYAELEKRGLFLPVVEAYCKYAAPAVYDQLLRIRTHVSRAGRSRVEFVSEVADAGDERALARSRVVLACVGADGRPKAIPGPLRASLAAYRGPSSEASCGDTETGGTTSPGPAAAGGVR